MRKFFKVAFHTVLVLFVVLVFTKMYLDSRPLPTTPTVAVAANTTAATVELPKPASCRKADTGTGYLRATNDLFAKYGLMTICDEGYGAVNLKKTDNVKLTTRPKTGPLVINGCVATVTGYENRESYAGCRIAVTNASEIDGKIVLHTTKGDFTL